MDGITNNHNTVRFSEHLTVNSNETRQAPAAAVDEEAKSARMTTRQQVLTKTKTKLDALLNSDKTHQAAKTLSGTLRDIEQRQPERAARLNAFSTEGKSQQDCDKQLEILLAPDKSDALARTQLDALRATASDKSSLARRTLLIDSISKQLQTIAQLAQENPEDYDLTDAAELQAAAPRSARSARSTDPTEKKDPISSWDIYQDLADAIGEMDDSYLSVHEYAVKQYSDFFSDFSNLKSKLQEFINSGKDGNIILNSGEIRKELDKLLAKYSVNPVTKAAVLFPKQSETGGVKGASQEDAKAWASELGIDPNTCVKQLPDGTWVCTIDTSPLTKMKSDLPHNAVEDMNSAKFQAWMAGFDAQAEKLQTAMQSHLQKYSTASSTFDNLIKVLSSTISSLLETDKSFFSN
ncbi:Salmonella invasion protein D [Yersinia nurmii]|uniref:Salmonella invasion protein D n=1 Tax=Yersinia nurmii TaxID=685706 RepID=A0ABP1Y373_9GAMM|nr:type III secretion system needle tip protein SctA [Yersinia nurmii]CND83254.1 Salmonella invasion protein D [Yersinia nurmii]